MSHCVCGHHGLDHDPAKGGNCQALELGPDGVPVWSCSCGMYYECGTQTTCRHDETPDPFGYRVRHDGRSWNLPLPSMSR